MREISHMKHKNVETIIFNGNFLYRIGKTTLIKRSNEIAKIVYEHVISDIKAINIQK
jgi:hypothetical protein